MMHTNYGHLATTICLTVGLALYFPAKVAARQSPPTNLSGNVSGALTLANSPYVVTGDITIPENASLTVEPGVAIKFGLGRNLFVRGTLIARGNAQNPIYFTSIRDDAPFGDTNGDGATTRPAPGDWGRLEFAASSGNSGLMEHCVTRYGGNFFAMIRLLNASPTIRQSVIDSSRFVAGLSMEVGGNPLIEQNNFRGNLVAALYMQANAFPRFSDNTASGNGVNGILFPGGTITISGIWNAVDLPYVLSGDLNIGDTDVNTPPIDLTLRPGAVIKLNGRGINVRDAFRAAGKPDSLIVFTAFTDDGYGGDTNNDGNATQPAPGQWSRIEFAASSGSSGILERCLIRYGGGLLRHDSRYWRFAHL